MNREIITEMIKLENKADRMIDINCGVFSCTANRLSLSESVEWLELLRRVKELKKKLPFRMRVWHTFSKKSFYEKNLT